MNNQDETILINTLAEELNNFKQIQKQAKSIDLQLEEDIIKNEKLFKNFQSTYSKCLKVVESFKNSEFITNLVSGMDSIFILKGKLKEINNRINLKLNDKEVIIRIIQNGEKEVYHL